MPMSRPFAIVVLLTLWATGSTPQQAGAAAALELVRDGKPTASIVMAREPTRAAQFAAFELQWHIRQITGATLPIVRDAFKAKGVKILVGPSQATAAVGLTARDLAKPQEYVIRFLPGALVLAGRDADDKTAVAYDIKDPFCFRTWPKFFTEQGRVVHRSQFGRCFFCLRLRVVAVDAGRGGHVEPLLALNEVGIVDLDEVGFVLAGERDAGCAVGLVADDEIERGKACLLGLGVYRLQFADGDECVIDLLDGPQLCQSQDYEYKCGEAGDNGDDRDG